MAPVVLMLAGVIVRATTKKALQRLMNAGFQKASSGVAKSKANIINATDDNIISLITRAKARSKTRGKVTTAKPKPKTQAEVKEALKRNAEKVSSKKFGDKKLSDFGRVGPKLEVASGNKKGNLIAAALTTLSPSSTKDTSVASAPLTKYEKKKIRETPGRKAPKKKTTGPKQPGFPRLGPKSEKKSNVNKPTKEQRFTAQAGATKLKTPALEAGFTGDKAPPTSVLKKAAPMLRPKARPETVKKAKKELSAFGKKFKSERAKGEYSFPFKGKEYTTRYKEESVAEHKKKFPKKK